MSRALFSFIVGMLSPLAYIMGSELAAGILLQERVAGGLAVALYLAIWQFLVAQKGSRGHGHYWPTIFTMVASLLLMCLLVGMGGRQQWINTAGPILFSGCLGIVAGAVVAWRVNISPMPLESCRRAFLICASILAGMAIVVAVGVLPPASADTFPAANPGGAVIVFLGIVVVAIGLAAYLAILADRAAHEDRPAIMVLIFLTFLAFALGCGLAPSVVFLSHGPSMRIAGILGILCSAIAFIVAILLGVTAIRLPGEEPTD